MRRGREVYFICDPVEHKKEALTLLRYELIGETKYGDSIKAWLPNNCFQLMYKASVYVENKRRESKS